MNSDFAADLADEPMDETDIAILSRLHDAADLLDPPRPGLVDDVLFTLSLAAMNAEIARWQEDALALRDLEADCAENITFATSTLTLMIVIGRDGDTIRVDAWVTGGGVTVELIQGATRRAVVSDHHGRLSWDDVRAGRARFLVHPWTEGGRPVVTPSIEV